MAEILFLCGGNRRAVIASLSILHHSTEGSQDSSKDDVSCIWGDSDIFLLYQFEKHGFKGVHHP